MESYKVQQTAGHQYIKIFKDDLGIQLTKKCLKLWNSYKEINLNTLIKVRKIFYQKIHCDSLYDYYEKK